jgi:hypothetical protein
MKQEDNRCFMVIVSHLVGVVGLDRELWVAEMCLLFWLPMGECAN